MMPNTECRRQYKWKGCKIRQFLCPGDFGDAEEVTISGIGDGHDTDTEKFSRSSAKGYIGSRKVVYGRLGQHGVVLDFRLAQWRAVSGDEDQLGYINKKWKREKGETKQKSA